MSKNKKVQLNSYKKAMETIRIWDEQCRTKIKKTNFTPEDIDMHGKHCYVKPITDGMLNENRKTSLWCELDNEELLSKVGINNVLDDEDTGTLKITFCNDVIIPRSMRIVAGVIAKVLNRGKYLCKGE